MAAPLPSQHVVNVPGKAGQKEPALVWETQKNLLTSHCSPAQSWPLQPLGQSITGQAISLTATASQINKQVKLKEKDSLKNTLITMQNLATKLLPDSAVELNREQNPRLRPQLPQASAPPTGL